MSGVAGDRLRRLEDSAPLPAATGLRVRRVAAAERGVWLALRCATDPARGVAEHQEAIERMLAEPRFCALLCVAEGGAPVGVIELLAETVPEPHGRVVLLHCGPDAEADTVAAALLEAAAAWCARGGLPFLVAEATEERLVRLLAAGGLREKGHLTRMVRALPAGAPVTGKRSPGDERCADHGAGDTPRLRTAPRAAPSPPRRAPGDSEVARTPPAAAGVDSGQRSVAALRPAEPDPPPPDPAALAADDAGQGEPGPWRPGVGTAVMVLLGALSFTFTDVWSSDLLYGAVLPVLDVLFVVYLMVLVVVVKYRRRTAAHLPALLEPIAAGNPSRSRAR